MIETPAQPLRVFLAEDNRADVYLVELALREENLTFNLRLASDGEEALRVVAAFGETERAPDIALLDVNLPRQDGDQVLRSLRSSPCCGRTPICHYDLVRQRSRPRSRGTLRSRLFFEPSDLTGFLELGRLVKTLCEQNQSAGITV